MSNEVVKVHRDLNAHSFANLTQTQRDVTMAIFWKMKDKGGNTVTMTFEELRELIKYPRGNNRAFAKNVIDLNRKLAQQVWELNWEYEDGSKVNEQFNLFNRFKTYYDNEDGSKDRVDISINDRFQYLFNQLANFSKVQLENFCDLRSSYTKEIYRQISSWTATGVWRVKMDEFKRLLGIPKSYKMANIDKQILMPAIRDISKLMPDGVFSVEKVHGKGKGRPVLELIFHFTPEKELQNDTPRIRNAAYHPFSEEEIKEPKEYLSGKAQAAAVNRAKDIARHGIDYIDEGEQFEGQTSIEVENAEKIADKVNQAFRFDDNPPKLVVSDADTQRHPSDFDTAKIFEKDLENDVKYLLSLDGTSRVVGFSEKCEIGRDLTTNDFKLDDKNVSKKHVTIFVKNDELWMRDEGSTNGTVVEVQDGRKRELEAYRDYKIPKSLIPVKVHIGESVCVLSAAVV